MKKNPARIVVPLTRAALVTRALEDAAARARIVADLESALEAEGIEPTPSVVAALRASLDAD